MSCLRPAPRNNIIVSVYFAYLFYGSLAFLCQYQQNIFSVSLSFLHPTLSWMTCDNCTQHQLVTYCNLAYKLHCLVSKLVFIRKHCLFKLLPRRTCHYKTHSIPSQTSLDKEQCLPVTFELFKVNNLHFENVFKPPGSYVILIRPNLWK